MYVKQPKKLLILNILDILRKYTDEDHRLSQKEIADILKNGIGVVSPESLVMLADLMAEICHDEGLLTISDASDDEAEEV